MKPDQWARLYEEEKDRRLETENTMRWAFQKAIHWIQKYDDLVEYLRRGKTPLIICWELDYDVYVYLIE